jgi:cytidylate kinase
MPVITIAREFGAGGADIGAILAERLGVEIVDRSLILDVAKRLQVEPAEVEAEDEHPRPFLDRILRAVTPINDVVGVPWDPSELATTDPHASVVALTAEVIREAARSPDAVIVGRGARFVLGDRPGAVHVFLCAPVAVRVPRIARRLTVDEAEAAREVHLNDVRRAGYVREVHGQDWRDPHLYDLVVNTAAVPYEVAADLILELAASRVPPT